jgi:multiple sugar transport system permease protein
LHLSNYTTAWHEMNLGRLLFNTVYYAGGALLLQLIFDVAAAYSLSKLRPIMGNAVLFLMLATLMIPSTVLILPTYLTAINLPLLHLNLSNSAWGIWLPTVANAFNIFLLKRFFDSIPRDLLAAAAIDGAGPLRALWSVVLPMSRPILGVVSIFAVVNVWKDFLWPLLMLPDRANQTVNVGLYTLNSGMPENVLIASLAIASIPTILFFLIFQRNIMAGLTAGSLKG